MMSMRSAMNLPPIVLSRMLRMAQMAMNMGVGMGMVDMGATGLGQGPIPVTSATGPAVPHNMSVPGTMMEAHDPCMDPHNSYLAHQDQAMQIQQVSSSIQNTRSPVLYGGYVFHYSCCQVE
jgi:hypothetical protein